MERNDSTPLIRVLACLWPTSPLRAEYSRSIRFEHRNANISPTLRPAPQSSTNSDAQFVGVYFHEPRALHIEPRAMAPCQSLYSRTDGNSAQLLVKAEELRLSPAHS